MPRIYDIPQGQVFIEVNLSHVIKLKKKCENKQLDVFTRAAERYRRFLRNRFRGTSGYTGSGGRQWPPLSDVTEKFKEKKKAQGLIQGSPHWILRETDELWNSFEARLKRDGFEVGIFSQAIHSDAGRLRKKDGSLGSHCGKTIVQLAELHHTGGFRTWGASPPPRPVVVGPDRQLYNMLTTDIQQQFGSVIREVNT